MVINQATIHIISCFFRNCKPYFARGRESADLPGTYAFARADAAMRCSALYDRGSWAGAMSRLAGCSSGRSVCARGGWSARRCGALRSDALAGISVQSSLHYGRWRLQGRFPYAAFCGSFEVCLGHCAVMRAFGVLRCGSVGGHAGHAVLSECSAFDHAGFAVLLRCGCAWHGKGRSGTTKTCPAPISGGRTAAGRASRVAARSLLCAQSFESGRVKWKPHYTPRAAQYA